MIETIYIYHTNDIHSHFENWPRIHQYLLERKNEHTQNNETVFLFDIGDHSDRWHPFTEGTEGKGNTRLLNEAGYDAVTIGNNEGITFSFEELNELYDDASFDIIVSNLYKQNKHRPKWAQPFKIYETNKQIKIGVIGLTANFAPFYNKLGWEITDPIEELERVIPIVENKADIIILLSHLGLPDDEVIANRFPMIDVIIGGHTHHILEHGKIVNESLLCCAGKYGNFLGKIELQYDVKNKKLVNRNAILMSQQSLPPFDSEQRYIQELYETGRTYLERPLAYVEEDLTINWDQPSPLAKVLCKALLEWCEADISFLNSGLLLNDLKKGVVTEYDIHNICPHPINPCIVYLTGAELKEVIVQTLDEKWAQLELKGFGFRGERLGVFVYEGMEVIGKGSSVKIMRNGISIDKQQTYKIAIPDLFGFAKFFPEIYRAREKEYLLPEFMRDLLKQKLSETYPYSKY